MYSATGTFVRWCSALSRASCSGVMYTVVEIFLRAKGGVTIRGHMRGVNRLRSPVPAIRLVV
jgi:hypothetical protein